MKSPNKCVRGQVISVFMLPIIILFWMTGWILLWISSQKTLPTTVQRNQKIIKTTTTKEKFEQEFNEPQILG